MTISVSTYESFEVREQIPHFCEIFHLLSMIFWQQRSASRRTSLSACLMSSITESLALASLTSCLEILFCTAISPRSLQATVRHTISFAVGSFLGEILLTSSTSC